MQNAAVLPHTVSSYMKQPIANGIFHCPTGQSISLKNACGGGYRNGRASETRERVKITPREKGETRRGEFSPPRLSFLEWGDFHTRSRFARSTIPEEKWGLLVV